MTESSTTTLYHPTLLGAEVEVSAKDVKDWQDQGWLKSRSKVVREAEATDAAE